MKSRILSIIIAIFGGQFGVHKFYLGETGKGILYLALSFTFIPFVLSVIDIVHLAKMNDDDFDLKYNLGKTHQIDTRFQFKKLVHNINNAIPKPSFQTNKQGVADEIHKLGMLMDKGLITFEEFERRKIKLLKSAL